MANDREDDSQSRGSYQVLARRFRPARFDDVVGQQAVVRTLRSCLSEQRLPHAFLFCGSRGVGKTTSARILARAVNCAKGIGPDPCGECGPCREILAGTASDVVELDAASHNGVDEVRALREQAGYAPLRLRKKVFVLDEVHMFSRSAFNALLKILEEPPEHVVFVLATTELHKVPDTVRSRCQVLTFRRIQEHDIRTRLQQIAEQEGVAVAPEILAEIAASSLGGLRDAETALERVLPLASGLDLDAYRQLEGRLGFARSAELVEALFAGDAAAALRYAHEAAETGVDERECLGEILTLLRQIFVLLVDGPESMLLESSGESRRRLQQLAQRVELPALDARMQILILARDRLRLIDDRRVFFELTLVRLAQIGELLSLGEIAAGGGAGAPAPAASAPFAAGSGGPAGGAAAPAAPRSPRAAPREPAAPADAGGSPWQRAVETALAEKRMIGAVLGRAQLSGPGADDVVRLSFAQLGAFDRRLLETENTRPYLEELFARIWGRPLRVELQLPGAAAKAAVAAPAERPAAPRASVQDDAPSQASSDESELPPIGRELRELFGARFLGKQDPEPEPDGSGSGRASRGAAAPFDESDEHETYDSPEDPDGR